MKTLILVAYFLHTGLGSIIIPYNDPTKCGTGSYFQHPSLLCVPCGSNQIKNTGLSCKCAFGFRITQDSGGPDLSCAACPSTEVTSKDGWSCVKCATDGDYDSASKTCRPCPAGTTLVERQANGLLFPDRRQQCLACLRDTKASKEMGICQRCNNFVLEITNSSSCTCPVDASTTAEEDGICFSPNQLIPDLPSIYTIRYPNGQIIESAFFRTHLRAAQSLCKRFQNYTACQILGNLCVLSMYNQDNFLNAALSNTDACKEYLLTVTSFSGDFVGRLTDWPVSMPWLYYKVDKPVEVLDKTDIDMKFERRQYLKFAFVSYSARGTFLGISNDSSVLQLCPIDQTIASKAFYFTTPYSIECKVKLSEYLNRETIFYDMYMFINNDESLYPVPVLVGNIPENSNSDRSKWVLTRRFFLVDNISGQIDTAKSPVVIQYAESIDLNFRLRSDGQIFPPVMKVSYGAVAVTGGSQSVNVKFSVSYEMNVDKVKQAIEISVGVLSVLGIIYATIRIVSWRRRQNLQAIDFSSLAMFVIFVCSALSLAFLTVIIGVTLHWLFFFKQQTVVIRFLPTSSQEYLIKALLISAFVMKSIDVIYMLYSQVFVDIFFIDWERPRGTVNLNRDGKHQNVASPVSIMRTLFVANEWRELQTTRRIKPTLQIILVLFFMKVVGLEHWSTTDPVSRTSVDLSVNYVGEISLTLRIAVICLLFLLIALVQWIIFGFIYERFIGDAMGDFIDFCSMSNISLFIISHSHFGYYLHGRSVHGRSDTSLHELYEQFQREEDNLCGKRGLEANSERQTFEVALTFKFKNEYSKIKQPLLARENQGPRLQMTGRQNPGLPGSHLSPSLERSVLAYTMMNKYLASFIEHAIQDNDYVVKDKFLMEKLLQNELQAPVDKCFFYNDDSRTFTDILLYGQEWSLLILNLLWFLVIDWLSNWNIILAATVTYFLDILIVMVRDTLGKKNIARKTMVDEKFLI